MADIIVIAAHPDDEIMGAGGTLLKHVANNDKVYWLIITNMSEENGYSKINVAQRQKEIKEVALKIGFIETFNLNYKPAGLQPANLPDLIFKISDVFNKLKPECIYVMNRSDAHSDHRIVFEAVMACTKSFRYSFIKKVLMYECISETEFAPALPENIFIPNYFVDITNYLEKKLDIMKIYASELGDHPFPRSLDNVRALAHYRGAIAGIKYAEAFQLIKYIDK
jgi:N-acetylglucosamine malate deacetylase 1